MSLKEAYLLSVTRIILAGFMFGNLFSIIYSLAGGLLSLSIMALLKKSDGFSVMGISIAGGVMHNLGQVLTAMFLLDTTELAYYMAILAVTGTIAGILVGLCSAILVKKIPAKLFA
jgi:heptaprenyl diphosphate synthase